MSYLKKVLDIPSARGVRMVAVYHNNDCPKLNGGECTCDAEIEVSERITDENSPEIAQRMVRQQKWGRKWRMS